MTCHKMQGQTIKKGTNLVIHWNKKLPAAMAYVMMGRIEDVENLYITGTFNEKKIRCEKKALEEALRIERISFSWKTKDICYLSLASLNVRSLSKHHKDILADYKILQKDVICLQETWLHYEQENFYSVPEHTSHFASAGLGKGLATFSKVPLQNSVSFIEWCSYSYL